MLFLVIGAVKIEVIKISIPNGNVYTVVIRY